MDVEVVTIRPSGGEKGVHTHIDSIKIGIAQKYFIIHAPRHGARDMAPRTDLGTELFAKLARKSARPRIEYPAA